MSKVTLDEFTSVGDPLLSDAFEIIIPNLPTGLNSQGGRFFRLQCKTFTKPGATLEEVLQEAYGHTLRYAGRKTFSGSISSEFVENSQMRMYTVLEDWVNVTRSTEFQLGLFKREYSVTATINIFDQKGAITYAGELRGFFPKGLQDISFDGTAAAVPVNCDFSYDHFYRTIPAPVEPSGVPAS
jgi:hypothetical protein